MRKDAIISMRNAATVLLACAIMLLCFAWRSPAYASVSGSIELSCGAEHAGEHVALAGDGYALTKVASAEVDGASASVAYATEEAFSSVDRNWAALDGAGLRAAAHEVFAHAEKHGVKPQATAHADAAGKAVFSSLEPGLYLISRFEVVPANAEFSCDPALVSVPATIDGVLTYAVEVTPKFEHEPLTPGPDSGPGEDGKPAARIREDLGRHVRAGMCSCTVRFRGGCPAVMEVSCRRSRRRSCGRLEAVRLLRS